MFTKLTKLLILILIVVIAVILIMNRKSSTRLATETNLNLYQYQKTSDNLAQWINKLATYENCSIEGIRDNNGLKSFSCLCFQEETFIRQVKKYNLLPYAEDKEILNMIGNCDFQKELAYKMIKDNPENIWHWKTSVKKIGVYDPN